MDSLFAIFSPEARAMIKQLAHQIELNEVISSFSPSVYDTAWLAMICKGDTWLFPECFEYLLETQGSDGSWPAYASETDGIVNTMAAVVALKKHEATPGLNCIPPCDDVTSRVSKAEKCLRAKLQDWDVSGTVHVGFEVLVPTLLELLEKDCDRFEFPGRCALMVLNESKLSRLRPEALYGERRTTLLHSLEAFVGRINFDQVSHHLSENGSMMASPSATAAYLMNCSHWDESAERYLLDVVALGTGRGNGGVPDVFPSSVFEIAWVNGYHFLKAGLSLEDLGLKELEQIGAFLHTQFLSQGEIVACDIGFPPDVDDTAKTIVATNLLGLPTGPDKMIDEFEAESHFLTYKDERHESVSANCNVLDALLHSPKVADYSGPIVKVIRYLCKKWFAGSVQDKWHFSEYYSLMLLSQTFVKVLQLWDGDQVLDLPQDLIHDQIPLVLFQVFVLILNRQSDDGSWPLTGPSREVTAYAILALKAVLTLPWLAHFRARAVKAIKRGSTFLVMNYEDWSRGEFVWIGKVNYAVSSVARAYCLAALCADTSRSWGEKVLNLVSMPSEKVVKLSRFFSQLPMLSKDELWLLEADVATGYFYLPQLIRISSDIFPRQEKVNYKYVEYIPFAWISTNRRNGGPLSGNVLWEMMMLTLLGYQLDEFMETIFSKDEQPEDFDAIKSTVRQLCEFPSPKQSKLGDHESHGDLTLEHINVSVKGHSNSSDDGPMNGSVNGQSEDCSSASLEHVKVILSRYASYVLQHNAVLESPEHICRQLYQELENYMLAHIEQDKDNLRLATQQRTLPKSTVDSVSGTEQKIMLLSSPRSTYFTWIAKTSADHSGCPFFLVFLSCLIAPGPGEAFFKGARQHYLFSALSRHLANLVRQYNDYASVARDRAENNLNSLNFPEFHERDPQQDNGSYQAKVEDEDTMKRDLFFIAEYERECLNLAIDRLNAEMRTSKQGIWKSNALQSFIDLADLYGQIYVARDITNRVK